MSIALKCPSCGAAVSPDGSASYVACKYCTTSISVTEFFKDGSTDTLQSLAATGLNEEEAKALVRLLENAAYFTDAGDYSKARHVYEKILELYPRHLPSRFNLALCELHSGEGDCLARATRACHLVKTAAEGHELIPSLLASRESIAYNIASIGVRRENVMEAIKFLELSLGLVEKHPVRDALVSDFFDTIYQKQNKIVRQELAAKGTKYSPNRTLLTLIRVGSPFSTGLADLGCLLLFYLKDNPNAINSKIAHELSEFHATVQRYCNEVFPRIKIGFLRAKWIEATRDQVRGLSFS